MTDDNQRANAKAEMDRAKECLDEAMLLQLNGHPYGAVARAYYAVFHAARALLYSRGLETRSHRAVLSMVGEHFVRTGSLKASTGRDALAAFKATNR